MVKSKKTAVSCYLDPKLVDAYDRLEGKKPTMSSLFDFALGGISRGSIWRRTDVSACLII